MILEIVSPEATLLSSEVDIVTVPGINGKFQMLDSHAPIVSLLTQGNVIFKGKKVVIKEEFENNFTNTKEEFVLPIKSGTVEMKDNKVIILAD